MFAKMLNTARSMCEREQASERTLAEAATNETNEWAREQQIEGLRINEKCIAFTLKKFNDTDYDSKNSVFRTAAITYVCNPLSAHDYVYSKFFFYLCYIFFLWFF